jgi:hypothetical protein
VFVAEQKAIVQQQLRSAEVGQKTSVRSAKNEFDRSSGTSKRSSIRSSKRLKLQAKLDAALEQIRINGWTMTTSKAASKIRCNTISSRQQGSWTRQ